MKRALYLTITPFFPSKGNWRGAYVYDQVKALMGLGLDVAVFLPGGNRFYEEEYCGIRVVHFPMRETRSYLFNGIFNKSNRRLFLKALDFAKINPGDVAEVHCHTGPYGNYGLALKEIDTDIKVLVQHHDRDPYTVRNGKFAGWWPNLYYRARNSRRIFSKVDLHICISEGVKDNLHSFPYATQSEVYDSYLHRLRQAQRLGIGGIESSQPSIVLYNGVDTSIFYPKRKNHDIFTIGCIANFEVLKDHITLLKAVKYVVDSGLKLKLILIGSGPTEQECRKFIENNGLSLVVEFRHEVRHEQLCDFYNSLDLFVMPSFFEGFGCVFTEAAACGVPFVCCRNQGASEYIPDDELDLWAIKPHDYISLAEIIRRQITAPLQQHYRYSLDINVLVREFVNELQKRKFLCLHGDED